MRLFNLAACLMALLTLAACGSGASDNTLSTGLGGGTTTPVLPPVVIPTPTVPRQDATGLDMTDRELAFASYLYEKVNELRVANALAPLTWDLGVAGVAWEHTKYMRTTGLLTHDGPGGCALPQDCLGLRLMAGGVAYLAAGENVGRTFNDPDDLMAAWQASATHNAILLDPNWTHVGFGYGEGTLGPWVTLNCIQR
jgi:uncharacterized protein YkwD